MTEERKGEMVGAIPRVVETMLTHVSLTWGFPLALAQAEIRSDRKKPVVHLLPSENSLQASFKKASRSCQGPWKCFPIAAAKVKPGITNPRLLISITCGAGKVIAAAPFCLPGNQRYCLFCGCLDGGFRNLDLGGIQATPRASGVPLDRLAPQKGMKQSKRLAGDLLRLSEEVKEILGAIRYEQWFREASKGMNNLRSIFEQIRILLWDPESDDALLELLKKMTGVQAVARLEVKCDGQGKGRLSHRSIAEWEKVVPKVLSRRQFRPADIELKGSLLEGWDRFSERFAFDSVDLRDIKKAPNDPLNRYIAALKRSPKVKAAIRASRVMQIGRLGVNVAPRSCDVEPHCEYKDRCMLFAKEEEAPGSAEVPPGRRVTRTPSKANDNPWRRRMVAVDVLFSSVAISEDRYQTMILQIASLLHHLRIRKEEWEMALLRGIAGLEESDQRHYLRYLFDNCLAIKNEQQRGAAFERLMTGMARLVPGWIPGRPNVYDIEGRELDVVVFVEPSVKKAKYWFETFGAKIAIECKNYARPLKAKEKGVRLVEKLRGKMRRNRMSLGLLVNTGQISDQLLREAEATWDTKHLVVPFDGSDLRGIIENPRDAEGFFKQRISHAKAGLKPRRPRKQKGRRRGE